jgi:hypothetical protein
MAVLRAPVKLDYGDDVNGIIVAMSFPGADHACFDTHRRSY